MTYNYEGDEYQIVSQTSGCVEITCAFRKADFSHIEIINVADYKVLGSVHTDKISVHIQNLQLIMSMLEMNSDIHTKEWQEILNAELEESV